MKNNKNAQFKTKQRKKHGSIGDLRRQDFTGSYRRKFRRGKPIFRKANVNVRQGKPFLGQAKMNFRQRKPIFREANVNVRRGKLQIVAENHPLQFPQNTLMQRQVFRFRP